MLGLDLQGGSHILLEVDTNDVRKEKLETLRDDVRRVLRDARDRLYRPGGARQQRRGAHPRRQRVSHTALAKLRELSLPLGGILGGTGQRSLDVTERAAV